MIRKVADISPNETAISPTERTKIPIVNLSNFDLNIVVGYINSFHKKQIRINSSDPFIDHF
jgi:hypothetical protein